MSNNDWTNKLRDQLADYQEPVSRDLWAGIEQSLAQKTGHQEVTGPGKIIHIIFKHCRIKNCMIGTVLINHKRKISPFDKGYPIFTDNYEIPKGCLFGGSLFW